MSYLRERIREPREPESREAREPGSVSSGGQLRGPFADRPNLLPHTGMAKMKKSEEGRGGLCTVSDPLTFFPKACSCSLCLGVCLGMFRCVSVSSVSLGVSR